MDSERRNRVAALLATSDQIPAAVGRELLADHDAAEQTVVRLQARLYDAQLSISLADARAALLQEDGARLAGWIIRHPCPGPEMTEVLDLHDRMP